MKEILENLFQHKTLTREEAKSVMIDIASGKYNHSQIAAFLTAFIMRNISLNELHGFRDGLLSLCHKIDLVEYNPMDVCGTGGDGKNTFNISTITSFVLAGAGVKVAKHGNYGVSSVSGSSNVMEHLGIQFQTNESVLKTQLQEAGICFLHAPLFHPAMRHVGPVRKELGIKTFFNMLGPLVNPAQPKVQMVGVFSLELARMYQYLFQEEDMHYSIVHAIDGFDEITLTADCKLINNEGEKIINARYFGMDNVSYEALDGGETVAEAAEIFIRIIDGKGTVAQNNVVIVNSALAILTYNPLMSLAEAMESAKESLLGLKAKQSFSTLKEIQ
ncbi:MAG: anthranilate phosphoribosyltransferase [Saprospiraceae bacterium]